MQFASARDKPTRARSIQGRMALMGLWLPMASPWTGAVVSELLKFPAGEHDDIVDTLSLIGRMVAGLETGKEPPPSEMPRGVGQVTLNELVTAEEERRRAW